MGKCPPLMCNFQAKWEWAFTPVFLQTYHGNRQPHHNALNFPIVPYPCSGSHELWHVSAFCRTNVTFTQISTKYCVPTPYRACKKEKKKENCMQDLQAVGVYTGTLALVQELSSKMGGGVYSVLYGTTF